MRSMRTFLGRWSKRSAKNATPATSTGEPSVKAYVLGTDCDDPHVRLASLDAQFIAGCLDWRSYEAQVKECMTHIYWGRQ
jgi:hypothetical protein